MKKIFKQLILLLVLIVTGQELAYSQTISKKGTTSAYFLQIHTGTRGSAMGGAVAGDVNDLSSMFWNVAGLADVKRSEIMIEQGNMFIDLSHNYLAASVPMGSGTMGINITSLTMGEFEETTFDNPKGTGRTFRAYSYAVGLSYAKYLTSDFKVGVNVKYVNETISYSSAKGLAFDIGTIYKTPFDGIRLGVSITNVGTKMNMDGEDLITTTDLDKTGSGNYETDVKLYTDRFDLPHMLRVGLAYDAYQSKDFRATVTVDGTVPSNNIQSLSVGTELSFLNDLIQLRGGIPYIGLDDRIELFSGGIGINYPISTMKVQFGFSYQAFKYLNEISRISIGIQF